MELGGCAAIVTAGSGGLGQRICRALALFSFHQPRR
jgi:NAD(P)-dependent dehydrogenase (short-subunit alcohol dehydrogenase family)